MEGERTGRLTGAALAIRNVVPASFVAPRLEAAEAVVLFSATLQPQPYYADLLGLPADHVWLDVPSPSRPEQLDVRLVNLSTRWDDRSRSVEPIAKLIVSQYDERPGNYLAFFSSFHYSNLLKLVLLYLLQYILLSSEMHSGGQKAYHFQHKQSVCNTHPL